MQRLSRFARYWDLVANSGRFVRTLPLLLGEAPFARFLAFADALYAATGRTHAIASERLYEFAHAHLLGRGVAAAEASAALADDYLASGARGRLAFVDLERLAAARRGAASVAAPQRQRRHLRA
jgi:hypothetical protein